MDIPTDSVTNLGVIVDENLSMDKHIAKVARAVCVSMRNIGMIRKHINQAVVELLTHALLISRLVTCHSLLHGLNKTQLKRLQRLQNTAARFVPLSMKYPQTTTLATKRTENHLQNLHVCIQDNPRYLAYLLV